jgi:hypothetical protein
LREGIPGWRALREALAALASKNHGGLRVRFNVAKRVLNAKITDFLIGTEMTSPQSWRAGQDLVGRAPGTKKSPEAVGLLRLEDACNHGRSKGASLQRSPCAPHSGTASSLPIGIVFGVAARSPRAKHGACSRGHGFAILVNMKAISILTGDSWI